MSAQRILVVENDQTFRNVLGRRLEILGFQVDAAENLIVAAGCCDAKTYHLALVDLSLGPELLRGEREDHTNLDGDQVVAMIKAKKEGTRVVVVSGHPAPQVAADALQRYGADYFLSKDLLCQVPLPSERDPLLKIVSEQMQMVKLNILDGFENPVRCITQGQDADLWRHQAVGALQPTSSDKGLHQYLNLLLERLGPARRKRRAAALMDVHPKIGVVEGVFWSKALGMAVHTVLASPMVGVEAVVRERYGDQRPELLLSLTESSINGMVFASPEPRSGFVEP